MSAHLDEAHRFMILAQQNAQPENPPRVPTLYLVAAISELIKHLQAAGDEA